MSLALGRARLAVLHISSAGCPLRPARLISVFVLVTLVLVDAVHVLCSPARLIGSPSLPSLSLSFSLPESRQKPKSDHLPRRADQCNLHTHVIANKNKSPVEKKKKKGGVWGGTPHSQAFLDPGSAFLGPGSQFVMRSFIFVRHYVGM